MIGWIMVDEQSTNFLIKNVEFEILNILETRSKAIIKLQSITAANVILGKNLSVDIIDKVYNGSPEISKSSFFSNIASMFKFWTRKELHRLNDIPLILGDPDSIAFDTSLVIFFSW